MAAEDLQILLEADDDPFFEALEPLREFDLIEIDLDDDILSDLLDRTDCQLYTVYVQ